MILTGKCKEDFLRYFKKRNKLKLHELEKVETVFSIQDEIYQNALIVEFFDKSDIFIAPKRVVSGLIFKMWYFLITDKHGVYLNNHVDMTNRIYNDEREECILLAIKKANEIYNKNK